MKPFFLIISILVITPELFSQCPGSWVNGIGAPPFGASAQSRVSLQYANGQIYCSSKLAGGDSLVSDNVELNCDPNNELVNHVYLWVLDTIGNTQWISSVGTSSLMPTENVMVVDELGNAYLTVAFYTDLHFEDTVLLTTNGNCMIAKYNTAGDRLWVKQFQGQVVPRMTWCNGNLVFALAYQNQISFSGTNYTSDGALDFLVVWMNTSGGVEQVKEIKGVGESFVYDVSCIGQNLLVQGRFNEVLEYSGDAMGSLGEVQYRSYQLFLNPSGNVLWHTQSTLHISGNLIQESSIKSGNQIISVGQYGVPNISFDNYSINNFGGVDGYVCSQNISDGSFNWLKGFGSDGNDYLSELCQYEGNLIVSGEYSSSEIMYEGGFFENQFEGVRQPILFMTDTAGKFICNKQIEADSEMGGLSEFTIYGSAIYAGINYESIRLLDDISTTLVGQRNLGAWKTCLPCDTSVGIEEAVDEPAFSIYPNPTTTDVQLTVSQQVENPILQVVDNLGRLVKTIALPNKQSTYNFSTAALPSGVYFCTLLNGAEAVATQKLVVQ